MINNLQYEENLTQRIIIGYTSNQALIKIKNNCVMLNFMKLSLESNLTVLCV